MKTYFQFGFDLQFFIIWITVSPARFANKVKPLLLDTAQLKTVEGAEILPFFGNAQKLVLRDGWRLYRGVPAIPSTETETGV